MHKEVVYVKERIIGYLTAIFDTALKFPPPGPNAANGHFQLEFRKFSDFGSHASISFENQDAKLLHETYQNMVDSTNICFASEDLHEGSFIDTLKASKDIILNSLLTLESLLTIFGTDESEKTKAAEDLSSDLSKLLGAIGQNKIIKGTHANGWVSVKLHNKCPAMKSTINDILLVSPTDPDVKKIKTALNLFYDNLMQLDTSNHKPWLSGEWQVQYSAHCLTLAKALKAME